MPQNRVSNRHFVTNRAETAARRRILAIYTILVVFGTTVSYYLRDASIYLLAPPVVVTLLGSFVVCKAAIHEATDLLDTARS
jgi:hypothetical protein